MLWVKAAPDYHCVKMARSFLAVWDGSHKHPCMWLGQNCSILSLPRLLPSPSPVLQPLLPPPFETASGLEFGLTRPLDVLFIFTL